MQMELFLKTIVLYIVRYNKGKMRFTDYFLVAILMALLLSSCVKETSTNPDGYGYTSGIITFTAYEDSSQTDLEVFIIDTEAYSPEIFNVSNGITDDYQPVWLYDRNALVYIASTEIQSSINKVNPLTLEQYTLLTVNERIRKISASPTEPKVVYVQTITGQSELALNMLDIETLDTLRLSTISPGGNPLLAWSTDGSKLAVSTGIMLVFDGITNGLLHHVNTSADYMDWDLGAEKLYVVRSGDLFLVDTLSEISILTGFGLSYPTISPNRRYMAAISQTRGNELIVIDLITSSFDGVKQVSVPFTVNGDYRLIGWSPSSRRISFIDLADNRWNIYTADEDYGYDATRVTSDLTLKKALIW